jgi:hypothetical protein
MTSMPATVTRRLRPLAPGRRTIHRIDPVVVARIGIVASLVLGSMLAVDVFGRYYILFDLKIYHGAMVWWASGGDLYRFIAPGMTLGYTYPPFAGLAMLPMAALSTTAAGWANFLLNLAALGFITTVLVGPVARRHGWPVWFAVGVVVPVAAATEPVRETLGFGQINLILAALVVLDLVGLRRRSRAAREGAPQGRLRFWRAGGWAGAGIGLATAVKLTPALFILYLLVTRQWRAAATAAGTAFGVTAAAFLIAPKESAEYWSSVVWHTERVGQVDMTPNQSLSGVLARLYDSAVTPGLMWLAFAVLLLAVGLSRAATAHGEGDELTAFTLVALTANAICPISWSHHFVFVVPAVFVLADTALRRHTAARGLRIGRFPALTGLRHAVAALGVYLLFVYSPIWPYEHKLQDGVSHYADGMLGVLAENSLALTAIMLVALLPWRPGAEPAFYGESRLGRARTRRLPAPR